MALLVGYLFIFYTQIENNFSSLQKKKKKDECRFSFLFLFGILFIRLFVDGDQTKCVKWLEGNNGKYASRWKCVRDTHKTLKNEINQTEKQHGCHTHTIFLEKGERFFCEV